MKTLKLLTIIQFIFVLDLKIQAQGYIVPNGVDTNTFSGEINVWNPGTQATTFSLTLLGMQNIFASAHTFSFSEPATIGVRVFLVQPNDAISLQPIFSRSWTELTYPNTYVFANGVPFYVGLYTGSNFAPPYPPFPPYFYLDPVYGWAKLVNNFGSIQLLNYAVEYQGGGIIAGTQTIIPIPEPSIFTLFALGSLLFVGRRWQK